VGRRPRLGRLAIYLEPRDVWIGVYVAPAAVYVCPLPLLVLRWDRRPKPARPAADWIRDASGVTLTPWQENLITRQFGATRHRPAVPLPHPTGCTGCDVTSESQEADRA
jgi:hypothetical protein